MVSCQHMLFVLPLHSWPEQSSQASIRYNTVVGHQKRSLTRLSHLLNIYIEIIICIAVDGSHSGISIGRRRCNLKDTDDSRTAESVVSGIWNPEAREDNVKEHTCFSSIFVGENVVGKRIWHLHYVWRKTASFFDWMSSVAHGLHAFPLNCQMHCCDWLPQFKCEIFITFSAFFHNSIFWVFLNNVSF